MTAGRTVWWAKDAGWWRRERVVELGEEFGPLGPAVVDWLACEAKSQNDGGMVKTGYRAVARGVFSEVVPVRPVLSRASDIGLLDDFTEGDRTFTCRISGWASEQLKARETAKKAAQRAESKTARPVVSPVVPKSPPTGQDRTGELLPPQPPASGGRQRDHESFDTNLKSWAAEHFPGAHPNHVNALATWMRGHGVEPTPENMRAYATDHPQWSPGISEVAA